MNSYFMYGFDKNPPWGKGYVNFSSGLTINTINNNRRLNFLQTNTTMADSTGNLLFSSNGLFIVDRNDSIMMGGDSINLYSAAYSLGSISVGWGCNQGLLSIPHPGHPNEYLMFQVQFNNDDPNVYWINEIDYHHISMDSAGGMGKVISHNNLVLNDSMTESFFSAVKHGNGRDWWLVKLQRNTNSYFKFLVTPTGITMSTQALGPIGESATYEGQSAFSQDGRYYARVDTRLDTTWITDTSQVVLMEFDRCTGTFSNLIVDLIDSGYVGGVAFSPNNKFLYVATGLHIYQYNLQDGSNMVNTKKIIATYDGYASPFANSWATFWQMFVGADKKIYCITQSQSDNMTVINQPDLFDTLCDAQPHSFHFGILNSRTCPNWPNYELGPEIGSICDSLGLAQHEVITSMGLQLFPNPANGFYNIHYSIPGNTTALATVYDVSGKKIEQHNLYGHFSNLQVSTAMYTPGLYVVNVSCNNVSESKRVLVVE
ncbi:MAG: T9SS type A sorting domain-containing protein [Bacteroidetes bacterium]|nr:T9SS type A sorting domain-containing protein [Bacteroidota bacterium]